jgi:hypothetical protein
MQYLAIFLMVYGVFLLAAFLFQFPFLYRMGKVKIMIKLMGKTGFNITLIVLGIGLFILGFFLY